jgi:cell division protein ZapA
VLIDQIGRIPESRMLLMAGLMLADRTVGLEERLREAEDRIGSLTGELRDLREAPPPEPQRVEVPVIPEDVTDAFAELTARAEALADAVEEKAGKTDPAA